MTVSVEYDKLSVPTEGQLTKAQERIGKLLRRVRSGIVRSDGRKFTIQDVAELTGISKATIANAEKGRGLSLNTALTLIGTYRGLDTLKVLDVLEQVENNFIPQSILAKIAYTDELTAMELVRTLALFPEQEYRVSYHAYLQLCTLGFATRAVVKKTRSEYYAATLEYAQQFPTKKWHIADKLHKSPVADADDSAAAFSKWATDTLLEAAKQHPEFKHLL